jgi:hypothetical protein
VKVVKRTFRIGQKLHEIIKICTRFEMFIKTARFHSRLQWTNPKFCSWFCQLIDDKVTDGHDIQHADICAAIKTRYLALTTLQITTLDVDSLYTCSRSGYYSYYQYALCCNAKCHGSDRGTKFNCYLLHQSRLSAVLVQHRRR